MKENWWRDAALLKAEHDKHGSLEKVAGFHGHPSTKTLYTWWRKHKLPAHIHGPKPVPGTGKPYEANEGLLKALKKLGDNASVEQLADHLDCSPKRVRESLAELGHKGYRVKQEKEQVVLQRVPSPSDTTHRKLFEGDEIRFGVVSDVHLGSKHCRLKELHYAYRYLEDQGVEKVLNPGDLVCGMGIYRGQINDINIHTLEGQIEYATENYPRFNGKTYLIGGNHSLEGDFGRVGANPDVAVCNQRDDMEYLGDYRATIELEQGTRLYLLHPKGGMGYSADYKVRKLAEGFEAGSKPHAAFIGHYHRRGSFEARGIQMLLSGCFEGGGSFGARLGMSDPAVGFHIITMRIANDGSIVKYVPEWYRFWPGRKVKLAA